MKTVTFNSTNEESSQNLVGLVQKLLLCAVSLADHANRWVGANIEHLLTHEALHRTVDRANGDVVIVHALRQRSPH